MLMFALLSIVILVYEANGHAYVTRPRSRNFDDCDNFEPQSVNQHCDNCNTEACGRYQDVDYTSVVHPPTGNFIAGGLLEVELVVTAHHKGYMELRLCSRPLDQTQDCFDEHLLVRDVRLLQSIRPQLMRITRVVGTSHHQGLIGPLIPDRCRPRMYVLGPQQAPDIVGQ
jgi:hypothetical protein